MQNIWLLFGFLQKNKYAFDFWLNSIKILE